MNIIERLKERLADKILKFDEKSARRIYFDLKPEDIYDAAKFIFADLGCRFATASAVDIPFGIEILYHFSYDQTGQMISFRVLITDKKSPQIQSIAPLFKAAEWIEREIWELLGVKFIGHPNLTHLLLIDEWPEGDYPLRHDHKH